MSKSNGVENAEAIVGLIIALLPWVLRFFGVDVSDEIGALSSGGGGLILSRARPTFWPLRKFDV